MTRRPLCNFYAASCERCGGVYEYVLFDDGAAECIRVLPCDSPMYLARGEGTLYVLLRAPFADSNESGVLMLSEATGEAICDTVSTFGEVGCHIAADGDGVFVANYMSGSILRIGGKSVAHSGGSIDSARQTSPHPHSAVISPDGKYVFSADLGTDTVYVYTKELEPVTSAKVPLGAGPRHLAFSMCGNYVYCINEMGGSITVFSWNGATLSALLTYELLKDGIRPGSGAAIKLSHDGKRIYVTERAAGEIITLAADGASLIELSRTSSRGKEPRDVEILANGRYLLVANQWGGGIAIFKLNEEGIPEYVGSTPLDSVLCVLERST